VLIDWRCFRTTGPAYNHFEASTFVLVRLTCPFSPAVRLTPLLCPGQNPSIDPTMASTPKRHSDAHTVIFASSYLKAKVVAGNEVEVELEMPLAEHDNTEPLSTNILVLSGDTVVVTDVIGDPLAIEPLADEVFLVGEVLLVLVLTTGVEAAVLNGISVAASLKP
jgi:hypothetical protein